MSEDYFSGYDEPQPSREDNQGGDKGNIPPGGGNVAGGDDPGDSESSSSSDDTSSSLPDLSKFLGRKKSRWTNAKKRRYDERSQALADFSWKSKKSQSRQKKPEKLRIKGFTGNPLDTQRFIQDAEIRFDYFRHCKLNDMDKASLIIALLEGDAKVWYNSIHVHISEQAAQRTGVPFNKDNELRTWIGSRKSLEGSFGGHSDWDRALNQWEVLKRKPYKVDPFCNELIRLASLLNSDGVHVKDKARISMTAELHRAWVLKTPHSESYIDYINLLRQMGHQLEDIVSFNQHVVKEKSTSHQERGDDKR